MKNILKTSVRNISITFVILFSITSQSFSEGLFDGPGLFDSPQSDFTSFYKDDGSLVNISGAKDVQVYIKDGKQEYVVIPKDNGDKTFIYDSELLVCDNNGCY